jgi:hypothetical protein
MLNKKHFLLVARELRLATVYGTIWLLLLWASGYPSEEWAMTVVVLYITLWLSREVVANLTQLAGMRLAVYGRRTLQMAGLELPDEPPNKRIFGIILAVVLTAVFAAIIGASLSIGIPVVGWFGLTPLAPYFTWIGWVFLVIGVVGLSLYFAAVWLVIVIADNLLQGVRDTPGNEVLSIYAITEKAAAFAAAR